MRLDDASTTYEKECIRVKQSYLYHSRTFFLLDTSETEVCIDTEEIENARNSCYYRFALVGSRWLGFVWVFIVYISTHIPHDICVLVARRAQEAYIAAKKTDNY